MYLILVAEDNDLQYESENDCFDYISRTIVKCENEVKTQTENRKKEIATLWNNISICIKSFNKITSNYHNDGLHLIIQPNWSNNFFLNSG